ncbi:MAG: hypothetical protein B7Y43_09940 [Sphingomonas sp. 28-62-20]|uniref:DUF427 domain-containing protein n=1 Tax=Sphingomonas sp. 28-62-20 TaxID=1970433 RepID=UPI000A0B542F|nr:DUF427 domain-containing protein [Sphingomonas sp.]OQW73447.1 MAG: hypothetical protein BVN33_10125 [Proteobacteria bacterium ST_bin13]OYY77640.1 MAG: hypothetical protein B7Y43_09940 [Sphingomonas sp. 28-62-20]
MPTATWNDTVIAQSDATIVIEGNHYFPADSVKMELLEDSSTHSHCPWKGEASYKTIVAGGQRNADAVWYYPDPKEKAAQIKGYFAFWKGVKVA